MVGGTRAGWLNEAFPQPLARKLAPGTPNEELPVRIKGNYSFNAPRDAIWSLLNDPAAVRRSIAGCEYYNTEVDGSHRLILNMPSGPFTGHYEGVVTVLHEQPEERLLLALSGSGPELVFRGEGSISLRDSHEQTILYYDGELEVAGNIASQSPRLLQTTANYLIRSFMETLEQQVQQPTRSVADNGRLSMEQPPLPRSTATMGVQDFMAELRRDRWIAIAVIVGVLLATFSMLGIVFVGLITTQWLSRKLAERSAAARAEEQLDAVRLPD